MEAWFVKSMDKKISREVRTELCNVAFVIIRLSLISLMTYTFLHRAQDE